MELQRCLDISSYDNYFNLSLNNYSWLCFKNYNLITLLLSFLLLNPFKFSMDRDEPETNLRTDKPNSHPHTPLFYMWDFSKLHLVKSELSTSFFWSDER